MAEIPCHLQQKCVGAAFRHQIADALVIESAVHHLDILADLAVANCNTLYAQTWDPAWGEYGGDSQGHVMMHFDRPVRSAANRNENCVHWLCRA
jgi:hypothetical protein